MGVRRLNTLLKEQCSHCIKTIHFKDLYHKKIAIDVSIYIYKFLEDRALIDNFYLLIGLFKKYSITPVFVFDGKPPEEKKEVLIHRNNEKKKALNDYAKTEKELEYLKRNAVPENQDKIVKLTKRLSILKKKSIKVNGFHIYKIKELMDAMGVCYIHADGEADVLCAQLVKGKHVYGCLSEDMDMFVYGCNRVFRDLHIYNETIVYYDYYSILKTLKLSSKEFREICVYSGTDYNDKINIFYVYKLFKIFKKSRETEFYEWLQKHNYIDDAIQLYHTYFMFDIIPQKPPAKLESKPYQISNLKTILERNNFIFLK